MLILQQVTKRFDRKMAVDEVSLNLHQGEIVGLLGPNGAGKTTIIRMINQIITPDKGTIRFKGEIMQQAHLQQVGYLPEERGLYKNMTVEAHALFLGALRGMSKIEALKSLDYWLEKFDCLNWRNKRIESLSKGMAQKVQFICTVLHDPDLLILDEPFSGFDPLNVELIQAELLAMKKRGKTILISTHNMKSVEEICDRVVLIHQSKKILEGNVNQLQEARKTGLFGLKFSGSMIGFVNALWTGFELVEKEEIGDNRFVVKVRLRGDNTFEDFLKISLKEVKIEAAWEVLPSMQDVFIQEVTTLSNQNETTDEK
ncbi:MAG: ATP-binding cassette domain-containing protein [Fluviicola sp.]|nr:ATP-binding cassette domain-containing protein [Fluviicola sp.]MBP6271732.1 ATP-binding cassette domain-containing protein [Fluviicola sp.]